MTLLLLLGTPDPSAWEYVLEVEGVPVLDEVRYGSLSIGETAYRGTGTLSFDLVGPSPDVDVPVNEKPVTLYFGPQLLFNGYVRQVNKAVHDKPGMAYYHVVCSDLNGVFEKVGMVPDIADGVRSTGETDRQRIDWFFGLFGPSIDALFVPNPITQWQADVQTLSPTMPEQRFLAMTMDKALDLILSVSGGAWYVDFDGSLHTFLTDEPATAPRALTDNLVPGDDATYADFKLDLDTTGLVNQVYVVDTDLLYLVTREDLGSQSLYGKRQTVIQTKETVLADQQAAGDAYIASHGIKRKGSLTTYVAGFHAGQTVTITNVDHGITGEDFRINAVTTTFVVSGPDADRIVPRYSIAFGDPVPRLIDTIKEHIDPEAGPQTETVIAPDVETGQVNADDVFADTVQATSALTLLEDGIFLLHDVGLSMGPAFPTIEKGVHWRTDLGMWFYFDGALWQNAPGWLGCRAYKAAAQTVTAATETTLQFDTEEYDTGTIHNPADNTKFTVPTGYGGKWRFTLHHWCAGNQGSSYVYLRINGTTAIVGSELDWTATADYGTTLTATVILAAGDYIEARAYRTTGTTIGGATAGTRESMEVELVAMTGLA